MITWISFDIFLYTELQRPLASPIVKVLELLLFYFSHIVRANFVSCRIFSASVATLESSLFAFARVVSSIFFTYFLFIAGSSSKVKFKAVQTGARFVPK